MRHAITIGVLALLLISSQALPQQPTTTGAIEGTVVRADSGEPVAGAQVTLIAAPLAPTAGLAAAAAAGGTLAVMIAVPPPTAQAPTQTATLRPETIQPVTTGADGRFAFKDLKPGSYRLNATANGFVRQEYGQRTVNGQGRPLFVTAGQTVKDAALRLPATGTISGRVFDENGQPATGTPVQLLRPVYNTQARNLQSVGTGNADDRGDYRIYGVPPGRYYLSAGSGPGPLRGGAGGAQGGTRFSVVFFPNVADVDQASTIEVKSGGEASFDMHVRRQAQTYRVRGRVIDSTGATLPANLNVQLSYRTFNGGGSFSSGRNFDPATGNFELQNVAPGDYSVTVQVPEQNPALQAGPIDAAGLAARQAAQAARPSAQAPIHVVDSDVEGVVLRVSPGFSTTGRVVVEGQPTGSTGGLDRIRLNFQEPLINQTAPVAMPAAADGTFQVVGLREGGEYRVILPIGTLPAGLYVKSIRFGGDDVLTKPLSISGSVSGTFEVTLRPGVAQITGTVTDAQSQPVPGIPVVLIPNQRSRIDLTRPTPTDQNGHFSLINVPPGDYKLFSWEAIDNNAYYDPEYLKQYEQQGKTVVVTESSNQQVEVKLIPAQ